MTAIRKLSNKIVLDTSNLEFRKSGFNIYTDLPNPTITPAQGTKGDLLISLDGIHYKKLDDGENTNWEEQVNGGGGGGSGADTTLSNLDAPTEIGVSLLPLNDLDVDLGSDTNRWSNLYAGTVVIDNLSSPTSSIEFTGDLDFADSGKIINIADPTDDQDAATKAYVDAQIAAIPPSGSGDFLADGSVPMTGTFDLDGNSVANGGNISTNSLNVTAGVTAAAVTVNTVTVASAVNATAATVAVGTLAVLTEATFNNKKLQDVATPEDATDAATKGYVDAAAPIKAKYSYTYEDFTGLPGTDAEILLFTLPTKAILTEAVIHETTQFTNGTGDTTSLFITTQALAIQFVSQALGVGNSFSRNNEGPMSSDNSVLLSVTSDTDIFININSSGGTGGLADLTDGSFDVYIEYKLLAE